MVMDVRGFVVGRPPLVIFVICLACFALTLMSFALYVKHNDTLADPDVSTDWNEFLMNFSKMGFCVLNSNSSDVVTTTGSMTTTKQPVTTPDVLGNGDDIRNFSVSMLLSVTPTVEFAQLQHNVTFLTGTIVGEQLGLRGSAAEEPINVTMQLSDLTASCSRQERCDVVQIYSCVYFQASERVFPDASKSPPRCEPKNDTYTNAVEFHGRMRGDEVNEHDKYRPVGCESQPSIRVHYKLDPTLTVYLSLADRSVMNLHLMHTSYFLFVMVVTILIYAAIKGNRTIKNPNSDKAELLHHTDT